jgi:uncharacterized membrane protein
VNSFGQAVFSGSALAQFSLILNQTLTNMATNCTSNGSTEIHYSVQNIVIVSVAAALFVAYQIFYIFEIWLCPSRTNMANNYKIRKQWVQSIFNTPNIAINGIQGMRNGIMSSSFFASTSMIIAIFAATTAKTIDNKTTLLQIQIFSLALVMGWTFLHWLIAIKGFTHLTFLFGISKWADTGDEDAQKRKFDKRIRQGEMIIKSATTHYFIGIRGFFLSLCLGAWIFNPIACLVVTFFVVIFMYCSDHSFIDHHYSHGKNQSDGQQADGQQQSDGN